MPDPNDSNITLTITGGSLSGGKIDLTNGGNNITSFNSSSTTGTGGNVVLAAFAGSNAGSGTITMPNSVTITTGGAGGSANGNVSIVAGATSGTVVNIGPINTLNTTGSVNATGYINVVLAQPTLISGSSSMTIKGGTITSGGLVGSTLLSTGTVSPGNLSIQSGAGINISSPGTIAVSVR